jgi:ribosomal protein S12 methylthiotransferase accessory factor
MTGVLERARALVGDQVGLIREVALSHPGPEHPRLAIAHSRSACVRTPELGWTTYNGMGAAVDAERAVTKAIGESVERYCAAVYDPQDLVLASFGALGAPAVDPLNFTLFTAEQYAAPACPYSPVRRDTQLRWVRGKSLVDGSETYVPAAYVYLPYAYATPSEPVFKDLISTGLACGPTRLAATYRGLMELIERDAFMLVWHHRVAAPEIDLSSIRDPEVTQLLSAIDGVAAECRLFLLTLDVPVPVVLALFASDHPPLAAVGLAADLDPLRAIHRALEEACLTYWGLDTAMPRASLDHLRCWDRLTLDEHALAHAVVPELRESRLFLLGLAPPIDLSDIPAQRAADDAQAVALAVEALTRVVPDVVAVDLTTADIDEAGFATVRAVAPGLQPLDTNHRYRHLGGMRLLSAVRADGRASELNPYPHPFP